MTKRLRHLHKIDKKVADIIHFLQPDTLDTFKALDLAVEARRLMEKPIMEAQQYG